MYYDHYASILHRLLSRFIDLFIEGVLLYLLFILLSTYFPFSLKPIMLSVLATVFLIAFEFFIPNMTKGQTIGMDITGIRMDSFFRGAPTANQLFDHS